MDVGAKIKKIRKEKGVSQERLAEKMQVAPSTIARWEKGKTQPNGEQLKALCEIFDVPLQYFFGEESMRESAAAEHRAEKEAQGARTGVLEKYAKWIIALLIVLIVASLAATISAWVLLGQVMQEAAAPPPPGISIPCSVDSFTEYFWFAGCATALFVLAVFASAGYLILRRLQKRAILQN